MQYRRLGKTGLMVSQIGLGAEWLERHNAEECTAIIDTCEELGINILDCWMSEPNVRTNIGNALRGRREKWIIQGHIGSTWQDGQYVRTRDMDKVIPAFEDLLTRCGGGLEIVRIPAPGLVELIEEGRAETPATEKLLTRILGPWRGKLDALVLGCTHYPFVKDTIARILGEETELLDGSAGTARETKRRLAEAGLLRSGVGEVVIEDSATGDAVLNLAWELLERPE